MGEADMNFVGTHIRQAHAVRGEHQITEYVASLEPEDCVKILKASPVSLSSLAARSESCRVEIGERRNFDQVIREWTVHVLSCLEGG
jgi:hypothetical protein